MASHRPFNQLSPPRPLPSTSVTPFPLSRIHRLLRPLRSSLSSLLRLLRQQQRAVKEKEREKEGVKKRKGYVEKKGGRRWEEEEWGSASSGRSKGKGKGKGRVYGKSKANGSRSTSNFASPRRPIPSSRLRLPSPPALAHSSGIVGSSPVFKGLSSMSARVRTTYGRRLLRHSTTWSALPSNNHSGAGGSGGQRVWTKEESSVREKVDKVVEAFANVLDAVLESESVPSPPSSSQPRPSNPFASPAPNGSNDEENRVDKLGIIAARVVGRILEKVVEEEVERMAFSGSSGSGSSSRSGSSTPFRSGSSNDLRRGSRSAEDERETQGEEGEEAEGEEEGSDEEPERETCLKEDEESRAALVDEWYDAVPSHYRRCALPALHLSRKAG